MVLHKEPVAEIRRFVDEQGLDAVIMYDMAHVLGLVGPHFQQPFAEGADLVTGSTHKTFFGTQRGVIGTRFRERDEEYELWETVRRRTFPGSVSNHHLGTMLGLLVAAYEMNTSRTPTSRRSSPTPRPSPARWPPRGCGWPATRPSTSPRPTR